MSQPKVSLRSIGYLLSLAIVFAFAASPVRAVGIPEMTNLGNPCFIDLAGRNTAEDLGAPDDLMSQMCDDNQGDADLAWAKLLKVWKDRSTDVPIAASYAPARTWTSLALIASVVAIPLIYAVFGVPLRAVSDLVAGTGSRRSRRALEAIAAFGLRMLIGFVFLLIFAIPFASIVGLFALLALMLGFHLRRREATAPTAIVEENIRPSSVTIANLINDGWASLAGLLAIALVAQQDWRFLVLGVVCACVVSLPSVILLRRRFRQMPLVKTGLSAVLGAILSSSALSDPRLGSISTSPLASIIVALIAIAAVVGVSLRRMRVAT